jgi:transcriptional regulator with XRE-family HTH domain
MPSRSNVLHEAAEQAAWAGQQVGRELRVARITSGKTQSWVARQLGCSQAQVSLTERGRRPSVRLLALYRHAAAVGLRLTLRAYPGGRRLLDAPQLALLNRFRSRIAATWGWEQEVPVPIAGDLRAGDSRISIPECSILIEAVTRLADVQSQSRSARLKHRDLGTDRLILLLSTSRVNRHAVHDAGPAFIDAFPVPARVALASLAAGKDPGGDAIILL